MHDAIHHATWADVLNCWRLAVKTQNFVSLEGFTGSEHEWNVITAMSEDLVQTYLPGQTSKRPPTLNAMLILKSTIAKATWPTLPGVFLCYESQQCWWYPSIVPILDCNLYCDWET